MNWQPDAWGYVFIAIAGFLATDLWRWLGVVAGRRLREDSEVLNWVRAVATALVAGVVSKLIVFPTGVLESSPLWLRVGSIAVGALAFFLGRQVPAIGIASAIAFLGAGLYLLRVLTRDDLIRSERGPMARDTSAMIDGRRARPGVERHAIGERQGSRPGPVMLSLRWLALAALGVLLVVVNPLADRAAQYNRDVTIGSTALYGTLRVMNSVMSVAKDADVTGGVGVASVTASPGQLLQPVTNTIDRMADLLFWLAIFSGVLSTLFLPVAKVAAIGLAAVSVLRAGVSLSRRRLPRSAERLARAVLTLCLLGAVVLPLSYAVAFHAGARMTDNAWKGATVVFDRINADYDAEAVGQIDALKETQAPAAPQAAPDTSFLGRLGSAADQSQSAISGTVSAASGLVTSLTEGVASKTKVITDGIAISSDLFTASIAIAVSYLVKILVMPLLILGAALYLMRAAFR